MTRSRSGSKKRRRAKPRQLSGPHDGPEQTDCRRCGEELGAKRVQLTIFDQAMTPDGRKALRTRNLVFCSNQCGSHYQMSCEG